MVWFHSFYYSYFSFYISTWYDDPIEITICVVSRSSINQYLWLSNPTYYSMDVKYVIFISFELMAWKPQSSSFLNVYCCLVWFSRYQHGSLFVGCYHLLFLDLPTISPRPRKLLSSAARPVILLVWSCQSTEYAGDIWIYLVIYGDIWWFMVTFGDILLFWYIKAVIIILLFWCFCSLARCLDASHESCDMCLVSFPHVWLIRHYSNPQ